MMERIDAQLVGFVERKQLNGGRDRAASMQRLLEVRSALVAQAERDSAGDANATSKLATYRQWSSSVVGRAEAKIKNALG